MEAKERVEVAAAQRRRREALIERLGKIADLAATTPLQGELGDVAYDLLREAAAQIASDAQHITTAAAEARRAALSEGYARATAWHRHGIAWKHLERASQAELLEEAEATTDALLRDTPPADEVRNGH